MGRYQPIPNILLLLDDKDKRFLKFLKYFFTDLSHGCIGIESLSFLEIFK